METSGIQVPGSRGVVVGATGGLGHEIVRTLAGAGMRLFVHGGRNQQALDDLCDTEGVEDGALADLRSESEVRDLCHRIRGFAGDTLDAFVYAAGLNPTAAPTRTVSLKDWDDTMAVNVRAVFVMLQELIPLLAAPSANQPRGHVVLLSSVFGLQSPGNRVAYGASKHALTGLVQSVSKEEGDRLQINAIAPGPVWGDNVRHIFADHARQKGVTVEEYVKARTQRIPVRRFLEARELASLTLFLCSPYSAYVTGQVIAQTGGAVE